MERTFSQLQIKRALIHLYVILYCFVQPLLSWSSRDELEGCRKSTFTDSAQVIESSQSGLGAFPHRFPFERVIGEFRKSPRMLYDHRELEDWPIYEFPVSNEWDSSRAPLNLTKQGIVFGVGTNALWDHAIRGDADAMVIMDYHLGVLMAQEYLFRPIAIEARDPKEFLLMIWGVGPEGTETRSFQELVHGLNNYVDNPPLRKLDRNSRLQFARDVLGRMSRNPKITQDQLAGVAAYYSAIFSGKELERNAISGWPELGPFTGEYLAEGGHSVAENLIAFAHPINMRYFIPTQMRFSGNIALLDHEYYGALSSPNAFARFKRIMTDGIYYIHSDFRDADAYLAINRLSQRLGLDPNLPMGFNLSNVVDLVMNEDSSQLTKDTLGDFLTGVSTILNRKPKAPLWVYETRRLDLPHRFFQYRCTPDCSIEQVHRNRQ